MTRSGPKGVSTTASSRTRGMLRTPGSLGQGRRVREACSTGRRLRIMLPKRRRVPSGAAVSTATPSTAVKPGSDAASAANWSSPALPASAGKFAATSWKQKTSDIGDRARLADDAGGIDAAVGAEAPLDVPGEQLHGDAVWAVNARESVAQRMPARMNDWTNWRWNNRKPTSSGADVIRVAAVMMDQSTPWSVDENTCRPTVSGRVSTELLTISGHRKLFQW